jgi:hypothetical protein
MENDTRCTCNPMDSEIYCPVHTTTEDYLLKRGLPTELDMTHIRNLKEPEKNPNEEWIMDLAYGGGGPKSTSIYEGINPPIEGETFKSMEQEKYYTPSIGDIRVGYECEHYYPKDGWKYVIIESDTRFKCWEDYIQENRLRTPYLTKEQIEGEGWKGIITGRFGAVGCYRKEILNDGENFEGFDMYILPENKIRILKYSADIHSGGEESPVCEGKCPSINEFRFINKLLGI